MFSTKMRPDTVLLLESEKEKIIIKAYRWGNNVKLLIGAPQTFKIVLQESNFEKEGNNDRYNHLPAEEC